jgi:ectoine hydroxylase-related dioxygenase (phytanoyl-CoA dioxygenase family)
MDRPSNQVLGDDELETYRNEGFLVPRYRLDEATVATLQRLTERLVADNPHLLDQPMTCPHVPNSGVQGLRSSPGWLDICTHPAVLDMVEQIIGPDIILWSSTVFYKRPSEGPAAPWHRDATYWPIRPLATTSVWIAIWESVVENGCVRFIPGSHIAQQTGRHFHSHDPQLMFPGTLAPEEFDESAARDVELEPGQMVIFDAFTIHGSQPNCGRRRRAGYSLRFMPATSHFDHDAAVHRVEPGAGHHTRPLILVRGADRCGRNDFSRGHPAPLNQTPTAATPAGT